MRVAIFVNVYASIMRIIAICLCNVSSQRGEACFCVSEEEGEVVIEWVWRAAKKYKLLIYNWWFHLLRLPHSVSVYIVVLLLNEAWATTDAGLSKSCEREFFEETRFKLDCCDW